MFESAVFFIGDICGYLLGVGLLVLAGGWLAGCLDNRPKAGELMDCATCVSYVNRECQLNGTGGRARLDTECKCADYLRRYR